MMSKLSEFSENSDFSFNPEISDNPFENMMNPDKMKEHLSDIMDGKIGKLAKEIADE